ncbi:RES domain-containing protein [Spirosoma migulaei]
MKEADLPSEDAISNGLKIIESSLLDKLSYEEIKKLFNDALGMVPKLVVPNASITAPIYRVTNGLFPGFDKNQISSFSHPPFNNCKKGRANIDGFPVFYAALSGDTALRELRNSTNQPLQKGDIVYISSWEVDKDIKLAYSQFIYNDEVKLGEMLSGLNKSNHEKIAHISSPYTAGKRNAFKLLLEGLSNLFIGDKSYAASSFLSHHLLYEDRENFPIRIEALLYPSVQAGLTNINFAIHPDFVKDHIKLKGIQKVEFESFQEGRSNLIFLEQGKPQTDGTIKWYKSGFSLKDIKAESYSVSFSIDPPIDNINEDYLFYSKTDNDYYPLPILTWKILNKKKKEVLNELAKFEEEMDFEKIYKKPIQINVNEGEVYLEIEDNKYNVEALVTEIEYKFILMEENN